MWLKALLPILKLLVFEGKIFVCGKNEDIRQTYDCTWLKKWRYLTILWLQKVKNVIKGSFPISKVLFFEG